MCRARPCLDAHPHRPQTSSPRAARATRRLADLVPSSPSGIRQRPAPLVRITMRTRTRPAAKLQAIADMAGSRTIASASWPTREDTPMSTWRRFVHAYEQALRQGESRLDGSMRHTTPGARSRHARWRTMGRLQPLAGLRTALPITLLERPHRGHARNPRPSPNCVRGRQRGDRHHAGREPERVMCATHDGAAA